MRQRAPFYDKPVVLLARDPRDVAVSQFFQWKFRIKPTKVAINNYPPRGSDISLFDFVMGDNGGSMRAVTDYLNLWAKEADRVGASFICCVTRTCERSPVTSCASCWISWLSKPTRHRSMLRWIILPTNKYEEHGEQAAVSPGAGPHDAAGQG